MVMTMETTRQTVLRLFRERFGLQIEPASRFDDSGINSMNFIQLMVRLEDVLGLEFEDAQLNVRRYETLEDLMVYIESLGVCGQSPAVEKKG